MASIRKTELHGASSLMPAALSAAPSAANVACLAEPAWRLTQSSTLPARDNVVAFPASRVLLPITLPCSPAHAQTQLQAVLRSPLGVYVISAHVSKKKIDIQFDIARDDIDFTLHTLILTLPEAIIGPLTRRAGHRPRQV